eukprot:193780-Alexandrium_andersonii.AAC.1
MTPSFFRRTAPPAKPLRILHWDVILGAPTLPHSHTRRAAGSSRPGLQATFDRFSSESTKAYDGCGSLAVVCCW